MNRKQRRAERKLGALVVQRAPLGIQLMFNAALRNHQAGHLNEAEKLYRQVLAVDPGHADSLHQIGVIALQLGRHDLAVDMINKAIAIDPKNAAYHSNMGIAFNQQGRLREAVSCYRRAIDLSPEYADAHNNLGAAFKEQGRLVEAVACFHTAIVLKPDYADAHNNLGATFQDQGRLEEAVACFRKAIDLRPDCHIYSNLLFAQNYLVRQHPETLRDLARQFGVLASSHAGHAFTDWHTAPSGQPLRVGLVSSDLHNHPVGYFLEGLLRTSNRRRIGFLAFPSGPREDELTTRIKPCFKSWQPIHALNDEKAARLIRASEVQILLDLSGHTRRNRLPIFAWRPAPVQATWLGYFATTGIAEMDYIIGDPHVTPPEEFDHFTETVWSLPEIYLCFTPPAETVEVSGLPALSTGGLTFGCFNNLAKINDSVVSVWCHVLHAVQGSRLILKAKQLNDRAVCSDIRARFVAHGLEEDRLLIEPPSSRADYLRAYHRVDIALDPFPYPGGTTSCEALWMGVPVLTKRGARFVSHAGETIAHNAGLSDWIAADEDDYVVKAVRFSSDLGELARLRTQLRAQVLASPLFDAPRFARNFEDAVWGMWNRWLGCGGARPL